MSRRMIYTLILVMAIATAAMIWVQLMTINHMAELQKHNFDSQINRTLDEVVDLIDQAEVAQFNIIESSQADIDFTSPLDLYPNNDPTGSLKRLGQSGELTTISRFSTSDKQSIHDRIKSSSYQISSFQTIYDKKTYENIRKLRFRVYLEERAELPVTLRIPPNFFGPVLDTLLRQKNIIQDFKYTIQTEVDGKNAYIMGNDDYNPGKKTQPYKKLLFPDENQLKPNFF
jgi:hypothetical protein